MSFSISKLLLCLFMLLQGNSSFTQTDKKLLILSNYNISEQSMRKNKKVLFTELSDTLLGRVAAWGANRGYESVILNGYTSLDSAGNNRVPVLLQQHHCSYAVVVNEFNVSFSINDVETTREGSSKSKIAFYNISSFVTYLLYDTSKLIKLNDVTSTTPHSSRPVLSGLLAAGPNIMSNKKDAQNILETNAREYMLNYFSKLIH